MLPRPVAMHADVAAAPGGRRRQARDAPTLRRRCAAGRPWDERAGSGGVISLLDPRLSDKLEKALFDPAPAAPPARGRATRVSGMAQANPRVESRV